MKARSAEEALRDRLFGLGPKRVLAIAADSMRAVATTGLLAELEARLMRRSGRRNFCLAQYFDMIGGASFGALIAAELAIGRKVAQATETLKALWPGQALKGQARFDPARLDQLAQGVFGERRLDAEGAATGLTMFVMPAGGAVRALSNTPRPEPGGGAAPLIADVVRASMAGGKFGEARKLSLDGAPAAAFVDPALGGLADPSMRLLEVVTLGPYGIGWPTAPDQLLMVSVGSASLDVKPPTNAPYLSEARRQPLVSVQALALAPDPWPVGGELGDMREARLSPVPMLHFVRLDARVDADSVAALGLEFDAAAIAALSANDPPDPSTLARLHEIGLRSARAAFDRDGERSRERTFLPPRFDPSLFADRPLGPPRTRLEALGRAFDRRVRDPAED